MINIYFKTRTGRRFENIKDFRDGAWINVENTSKEDLKQISKITGLDMIDIEDALDPNELPRVERKGGNVIIFIRSPRKSDASEELLYTHPLAVIINDKHFFTISITKSRTIRYMLKRNVAYSTTQRSKLFIYLLLKISQRFGKEIKSVRNTVLSQKGNLKNIQNTDILNLIENEDILNQYISSLLPMKNLLEVLSTGSHIQLYENDSDLFQDVSISMKQLVDVCNVNIKSIQSLRDSYQIMFTNKLNKTMQFLASFTIIMTIPTIISSFFGMNVVVPLATSHFGFLYIIGMTAAIVSLFFYIFVRNRWI